MYLIVTITLIAFGFMILEYKNVRFRKLHTHRNWLSLPIVDKYIQNNLSGRDRRQGLSCCYCGSRSFRQLGLEHRHDQRRVHICNQCNSLLYRTYR